MDAAGKDGAEGDPQEDCGAPQGTLHCAEDGAQARNIQQLDQEQLPLRHDNVVNAIVDANSRSFPVIRPKGVVNDFTVSQVADDQQSQAEQKTYHK